MYYLSAYYSDTPPTTTTASAPTTWVFVEMIYTAHTNIELTYPLLLRVRSPYNYIASPRKAARAIIKYYVVEYASYNSFTGFRSKIRQIITYIMNHVVLLHYRRHNINIIVKCTRRRLQRDITRETIIQTGENLVFKRTRKTRTHEKS